MKKPVPTPDPDESLSAAFRAARIIAFTAGYTARDKIGGPLSDEVFAEDLTESLAEWFALQVSKMETQDVSETKREKPA